MHHPRLGLVRWIGIAVLGALAVGAYFFFCNRDQSDDPFCNRGPVTFSHDIAPLVFAKCASCHRPGDAAPFPLLTYDDVSRRGRQIVDVTRNKIMPPWLPKEGHDYFVGARQLTA